MERVIIFKMIGLLLLVLGIFAFIAGLLFAGKFTETTGFAAILIGGALVYYSIRVTQAEPIDRDERNAMDTIAPPQAPHNK